MSKQKKRPGAKDATLTTNNIENTTHITKIDNKMQEEPNPVKDFMFEYIKNSEKKLEQYILEKKFSDIIQDIVINCYDEIIKIGKKEESIATLATGLLHYLLTNALLSSQRKIEHKGIEIDIVLPNLKTLEKEPEKTLIIYIPKTIKKTEIQEKLEQIYKIQPEKQNVWLVLSQNMGFENKSYVIEKKNNTFSEIIFDISQFLNVHGENKFKILKI
jgi:ribosomal protein L23